MDVQTLVELAGGVGKLADRLGVRHPTICEWKRLGHIPGNRVVQVSRALDLPINEVSQLVRAPKPRIETADEKEVAE